MSDGKQSVRRLRERVERALVDGKRGPDVVRNLEALARAAGEGSADALFAHRQLAELLLEVYPWRAALHLRQLSQAGAADDGVFALMGLCQALLGNFRAAVAAYGRAIARSPRNPWYHHNLGHLLDVGLGETERALPHLRMAHDLEPQEDEISASLAHCLACLGHLEEASACAELALRRAPHNPEHRALRDWIVAGAKPRSSRSQAGESRRSRRGARDRRRGAYAPNTIGMLRGVRDPSAEQVLRLLEDHMPEGGFSGEHLRLARTIWSDFCECRERRVAKPAAYAAAVEYAIARIGSVRGVTQAKLARRYGVATASVSSRYGEIRDALALVPADPRYCV